MEFQRIAPLLALLLLIVTTSCDSGSDGDADGDGDGDGDSDGDGDVDGDVDGDGDGDTPETVSLSYLGRYEHQTGPDHLMGSAVLDANRIVVTSAKRLVVVDRGALETGTVESPTSEIPVDSRPSNLDEPVGTTYFPKYFHVAMRGDYAYATTRYDGLEVLEIGAAGSGSPIDRRNVLRTYVIDGNGIITDVLTGCSPGRTLEAIEAARL